MAYCTSAYVFDRAGLVLRDEDARNLDQLNFSFAVIRDGKASGAHWKNIDAYRAFIARNPHILPVLSIGGWAADGFSQAAATAQGRETLVDSTLELMEANGFLGIDIDWEYPGSDSAGIAASPADRENYTLLLQCYREKLDRLTEKDGKQRLLATAIGALPQLIANIDCEGVGRAVDQVNMMTYDLQTALVASHHTALYTADERWPHSADYAIRAFVEAGIPAEKIMLGAAMYGRCFTFASDVHSVFAPATDIGGVTLHYAELLAKMPAMTVGFDDKAKAPYAINGNTFITYDDEVSIAHKGAYIRQNGLMGMMCWEYGGDSNGTLLAAMHNSLNN